jgi:hypothetical protein
MSQSLTPNTTYTITLVGGVGTLTPGLGGCAVGPFAGMTLTALQQALGTAQQALIACVTGSQPVQVMCAEGTGHRSVTYSRSNADDLKQLIRDLKDAMGIRTRGAVGRGW